jgi:hypothetical protein
MKRRPIAGVVGVIVFTIAGLKLPLPQNADTVNLVFYGVIGVVLAAFLAVWELQERATARANKIQRALDHLPEQFRDLENHLKTCEYVGSGTQIIETHFDELLRKAGESTEVLNTLAFFHLRDADLEDHLNAMTRDRRLNIVKVATNHGEWRDIFSDQVLIVKSGSVRQLLGELRRNTRYHAHILRDTFPIINMLLFDGTHAEVWFGFGMFRDLERGHVFKSNKPEICGYFRKYWHMLRELSGSLDELNRIDIVGAWIDVSYNANASIRGMAGIIY